jgi:CheY-like chemotaxis protein
MSMISAPLPETSVGVPATGACDILFVDDDPILRTAFTELLRLQGHVVRAAADGRQALEFLASQRPRLIITDIFMPEADGLELIVGLKEHWPPNGVLAISGGGFGPPELFLKTARLLGRARTLEKPFLPDELLKVVKEMLAVPAE